MAQVPATSYESTSLGDVAEFTIPFPFLSRAEVFVTVDGASVPFTWINDGLVQLATVPELGAVVRRYRSTAAYVPLHQFSTGVPFLPRYVDRDFKQTLYAVQESVNDTAGTAAQALATAEESLLLVQDAFDILSERTQYIVLGPYGPGLNFHTTSQVFSYLGNFYAPGPAITLPYTTTGGGAGEIANFRSVGDAILRSDLAATDGATHVGRGTGTVETALDAIENKIAAGLTKEQRTFANFELLSNIGNVAQINAAILGGVARIAFVGDSILEGDRDGLYDNSAAAILMRVLREQNKDVAFTFANFSLAGLGIGAYADPNYKGIAAPDNPAVGFYRPAGNALTAQWPGGSVIGKSWRDHVKDFAPDLTIIMHGANDVSGVGAANAAVWKVALDYQNTWAKVPSVAMGTAALPAVSAGYQGEVQIAADVVRGIARERNHTLIDVNRVFCLLRDAVDVDNPLYIRDDGFVSYPTGWVPSVGSTLVAIDGIGYALQGVGGAFRSSQAADINVSAKFKMPNWATQVGILHYRSLGTASTQYSAQVTSGAVFLYYGVAIIGSAVVPAIPNNTEVTLQVDAAGARHRVYLNGVLVIDVYDYGNVSAGAHGIAVAGASGLVYDLVAHLGNNYVVGEQVLTDVDIYGVDDFAANPNSLGGNGINHPTKLANTVIWGHSFAPLIQHIRSLRDASLVDVIPTVRAVSAEVFDTANTTLQMSINGVIGLATGMLVTPTGAQAAVSDVRKVVGGQTIVVRVFHSPGAYFLTTNVVLPAGTWLVTASATFTKDGAPTYRNTLLVTAVRAN